MSRYPFHPAIDPWPEGGTPEEEAALRQRLPDEYPGIDQPLPAVNKVFGAGKNPDLTEQIPARYWGREPGEVFRRKAFPTHPPGLVRVVEDALHGGLKLTSLKAILREGIDGQTAIDHFVSQAISWSYSHEIKTVLLTWILDSAFCVMWVEGHEPPYITGAGGSDEQGD